MALTDLPYAQRAAEIERQRRYAELLQQQAAEPLQSQMVGGRVVPISPWLGLAKMLQAGLGGYAERKAGEQEAALKKQSAEEAKKYFTDLAAYAQKGEKTGETPITTEISGYGATKPLPVLNVQDGKFSQAMKDVYTPATKAGMLARMMEGMSSENPDVAKYASTFGTALMPKEAEIGAVNPADWTPESLALYKQKNDYSVLVPKTTAAKVDLQHKTRTTYDKAGNEINQDYLFDPATGKEENIGKPYSGKPNLPPTQSVADQTQAGATLRSEYNSHPVVKNHSIISSAYQTMLNTPAADPSDNTGAGDMSLIFNYMKMLDPNSVVREGEYATAQNAGSIPQRVINAYNNAIKGTKLDPTQRQNFLKQAKVIYDTSAENEKSVRQGILDIAKDTGVKPRLYTIPEPKRRSTGSVDLPSGFVVDQPSAQSTTNFQYPNQAF